MPASGARASVSRSANDAVPLPSESMAAPIGSRSADNSVTRRSRPIDRGAELVAFLGQGGQQRSQVVDQLLDTWLLSANAFVNDEVCANMESEWRALTLQDS